MHVHVHVHVHVTFINTQCSLRMCKFVHAHYFITSSLQCMSNKFRITCMCIRYCPLHPILSVEHQSCMSCSCIYYNIVLNACARPYYQFICRMYIMLVHVHVHVHVCLASLLFIYLLNLQCACDDVYGQCCQWYQ